MGASIVVVEDTDDPVVVETGDSPSAVISVGGGSESLASPTGEVIEVGSVVGGPDVVVTAEGVEGVSSRLETELAVDAIGGAVAQLAISSMALIVRA